MKNSWRPYGALATELRRSLFSTTRLKLFLFTVGALLITIVLVNGVFDLIRDKEIQRSLAALPLDPALTQAASAQITSRLEQAETSIEIWSFVLISALAYAFGGFMLRPIQKAMRARRQFTADAAHDLRTPLTIMKTDIELGLRQQSTDPEELRVVLRSNLQEVERMTRIIEDLLSLARLDNPKMKLVFGQVDMVELVYHMLTMLRQPATVRGVQFTITKLEPTTVVGNANALERMVLNVLNNALDYTPRGGAITISLAREKRKAVLTIQDSGAGIADRDLPYIFERFYKANPTRFGGGSGLGLAIVREIITRHAGRIQVESKPGLGTVVRVTLPVVKTQTKTSV